MSLPNPIIIDVDVGHNVPVIPMTLESNVTTIGVSVGDAINVQILPSATYDGDYVVIPKAYDDQILETKNLLMKDDVTVKRVPYFETTNPDGRTVYIASEV